MIFPNYMVIGLSILLLLFLCWKEASRSDKRRLVLRLVASLLAVTSLVLLALPISTLKKINTRLNENEAILLTEGYNPDSIETFIKKNHHNIRIYQQDSIPWIDTALTTLHVFGNGLTADELKLMNDIPIAFHPSPVNNGFTAIRWNQKLNTGERLSVQGTYSNLKSIPVKLILEGFNTSLDSVLIPAKKTERFQLSTIPKHIGKAVYSIVILDKQDTLETAPVPVDINSIDTLKLLIIAASPGFENKFLKNWLSENRFAVASRTRISSNKFDQSFINLPSFNFDKITSLLLKQFDVIISDATELASLTKSEQSAIREEIQENGLGLIVKADSIVSPAAFYAAPFTQYTASGKFPSLVALHIKDADKPTTPLTIEAHSYIRYKSGTQPLVLDSSANILVSCTVEGSGKIVFTPINNTYTWMLSGNSNDYHSFWTCLLQKAVKRTANEQALLLNDALPKVGEPFQLYFETSINNPSPSINNESLSFQQNPDLPFQWQGIYWPTQAGWQPAVNLANQLHQWYVYDKNDWQNITAIERIKQTFRHINYKNNIVKKSIQPQKYSRVELPGLYFLLIFIVCCSFLWIEKKLSASY